MWQGGLGGVGGPSVSDAFKGMRSRWWAAQGFGDEDSEPALEPEPEPEPSAAAAAEPADVVDNPSHGASNGQASPAVESEIAKAPAPDEDV